MKLANFFDQSLLGGVCGDKKMILISQTATLFGIILYIN